MSQPPVRFVHASDLHLERPLGGVAEVPDRLREMFLEGPYLAAEQVFETVLSEGADALVLCGDVVDVELAGPRAVVFLVEQFQRLADHGVEVYWACSPTDLASDWPASAELPDNVHRFPADRIETIELEREGEPVALVCGAGCGKSRLPIDATSLGDNRGLFTLGVAYGEAFLGAEEGLFHYMALGGKHRRQTADPSFGTAHYCGTPQGRTPREAGRHGCTVVSVDESGQVKSHFVPTDAVRWITESIEITAGTDEQSLLDQMEQRTARLREKHSGTDLLITWHITGKGPLIYQLRPGGLSDKLIAQVRKREPADVWTVGIECDAALDVPPEWHDQETIMGDLLRQIERLEGDAEIPLALDEFLPEQFRDASPEEHYFAEMATVGNVAERKTLLREAGKLGIDLITIED